MSKISITAGNFIIPIIFALMATVITHDIYMGLTVFMLGVIYDIVALIGIIPIVGVFIQYWALVNYVNPWLYRTFEIPADITWIVNLQFWLSVICGAIITIWLTIVLIISILKTIYR